MGKTVYNSESILKSIAGHLIEERYDAVIMKEKEYVKRSRKTKKLLEQIQGYGLPEEQSLAIDRLLSANNACNGYYSERLYMEGFKDCAAIFLNLAKKR